MSREPFKVTTTGIQDLIDEVPDLIKHRIPKMAAIAVTEVAKGLKTATEVKLAEVFDRPTRWTLKSVYYTSATPTNLQAVVWFKDDAGNATPAAKYLWPEVHGGRRERKRYEVALLRYGILPSNYYTVPGAGARIDKSGNMETGQLVEILTGVRALEGMANTNFGGVRGGYKLRKRSTANFFVVKKKHGGLVPGIWERLPEESAAIKGYTGPKAMQEGNRARSSSPKAGYAYSDQHKKFVSFIQGRRVRPVLIFVKGAPQYDVRFPFYDWAQNYVDTELPKAFNRIVDETLAYHKGKLLNK